MNKWTSGIGAGFAATVVLSALMVMKTIMGVMPQLDIIAMMSKMMGVAAPISWLVHFMIGSVGYGVAYALVAPKDDGGFVARGLVLGLVGWLAMMVMVMPMAGAGLFGMMLGIMAPVMTLMLHLIFGAVLGWVYARIHGRGAATRSV